LLIQYNLADGQNRFGYISASLPKGVVVPELRFERKPGVLLNSWITDDPLRTVWEAYFSTVTECMQLATLGAGWAYIEITDPGQPQCRGFAYVVAVDLRENHSGKAIIQTESTPLYASASTENAIGTYDGGVELEVLQTQGDFANVRIGDEFAYQEGWMLGADLAMGAVPSDVSFALSKAVLVPSENESSAGAYAAASLDAQRIDCDTSYPVYSVLGDTGEFVQLSSQSSGQINVLFVPRDWVTPIPAGPNIYSEVVPITLAEDSPVYVRPEQGAPSQIALYKGTTVMCYPMGDWYLIVDRELVPWSCAEIATYLISFQLPERCFR